MAAEHFPFFVCHSNFPFVEMENEKWKTTNGKCFRFLLTVDRAATTLRAADAALVVRVKRRLIVDRDLFAGLDVS